MNRRLGEIIKVINLEKTTNQRFIAEICNYSLGLVNSCMKKLQDNGFLNIDMRLTTKAKLEIEKNSPNSAIILAAGVGMRMVPINTEVPKGLLEVDGEPLIERIIKQLHEVGVNEIHIVVGFMKEHYEYLIDEYNVDLIANNEYTSKNNLHSLKLLSDYLENAYIIPCDIWCAKNPFNRYELYSWYMVSDLIDDSSYVRVNRKEELVSISKKQSGNQMIGIAYLIRKEANKVRENIKKMILDKNYNNSFWEESLFVDKKMMVYANVVHAREVIEINTYEQLRELDTDSNQLNSNAINIICDALSIKPYDIYNIEILKKGMTNRSFLFSAFGNRYIMRIPGEGTDKMINRKEEADVYHIIKNRNICDEVIYMNPDNGYKITKFINNTRVCNINDTGDLIKCMKKLKAFHALDLKVEHEFNIYKQIEYYESLWDGKKSIYRDYEKTKQEIFSIRSFIEKHVEKMCLCHIDSVPDNFLFSEDGQLRLIDWEYAGMQDPHIDIAMFCIYALYDRKQIDQLIDIYFDNECTIENRIKIYCYIATCGLLWSNWCEYKLQLGIEFGEYSLYQYRYAKDYTKIVKAELKKRGEM